MNKFLKVLTILAVVCIAFTVVSPVMADTPQPPENGDGSLSEHPTHKFKGEKGKTGPSGLTRDEMQELRDSGLTMKEIAAMYGFSWDKEIGGNHTPGNGHLAEKCGLSMEEIQARKQAGVSLSEICPGLRSPNLPKHPAKP